jgi:hypothetical protein
MKAPQPRRTSPCLIHEIIMRFILNRNSTLFSGVPIIIVAFGQPRFVTGVRS